MEKSANKKWKESNSTLSFKDWIDRENKKKEPEGNFIPFILEPNNIVQDTLNREKEYISKDIGYKTVEQADNEKVLVLDVRVLAFSGILIVGSIFMYFYKKKK